MAANRGEWREGARAMTILTDDRPDPRQVTALLKPPDVPTFASPRLPKIDYDHHPAYGAVLPAPPLADRIRAIRIYLPNLAFVIIKWLVDYEHLPLLTKERNRDKPPHLPFDRAAVYRDDGTGQDTANSQDGRGRATRSAPIRPGAAAYVATGRNRRPASRSRRADKPPAGSCASLQDP